MAKHSADTNVDSSKTILYDLTIQAEWPQEPEAALRAREKSQDARQASTYRSAWGILRSAGLAVRSGSACLLPAGLETLVSTQLSWQVALSSDGSNVAILQEQCVEIRSSHDGFSTIVGRCSVPADVYPQWRHMAWSLDASTLAYACSDGQVALIDLLGMKICTIDSSVKPALPADLSCAVSSLIFKEASPEHHGYLDLIVISYAGILRNYLISPESNVRLANSFNFADSLHVPCISSAVYHKGHCLLLIGSGADPCCSAAGSCNADELGVSAWRVLSGEPYYKRVTDYESQLSGIRGKRQWVRRLQSRIRYRWQSEQQDGVYKLCLSPDGDLLSAVHFSGQLSLFDVPSLRIRHTWPLAEQPNFDEVNEEIAGNPKKRKQMKEYLKAFFLNDTSWWSNESVILSRGNGAVSVCSSSSLLNQLGSSPEWFEPCPSLTSAHGEGFLALECECKYGPLKRRLSEDAGFRDDEDDDDDDDDEQTLFASAMSNVTRVLYYVTDSDRFQPPRKRQKLVTRTYRLVSLNSTTPEQLYTRKIDHEEYGEALVLARSYNLDCDRVYQRQWRSTPVSVTSIHDYLGKIGKRSWVLHECLERVPSSCDAMRELLSFGLRGTQLPALTAEAVATDRFMLCDPEDMDDMSFDEDVDEEVLKKARHLRQLELLAQIDFDHLLLTQQELCRVHLKLLQYMDRLSTYEEILGGPHVAEDRYDPAFFETFRSQNIVEAAIDYARASDWRAVDVIFTYHGEVTLEHRLAILSNFPETFYPFEYRSLLPEVSCLPEGAAEVVQWECQSWREPDWCEQKAVRDKIAVSTENAGEYLYRERPAWTAFRGVTLTPDQLTSWYLYRASEIEEMSCQVDFALELVNRGMERDVKGLESLHDDLVVMETLVYECHGDDSLTLKELREMTDIERIQLMMSKSSDDMYVRNVRRWLLPFLTNNEKKKPGCFDQLLSAYLISVATKDLGRCLKVFEASKADQPEPLILRETLLLSLALQCVYAYEGSDQLNNAFGILECLPQRGFSVVTLESSELHDQVDELECHLSAAEILQNHDIPQSVSFIRDTKDNAEEANKLLVKLTRFAGRKVPALTPSQWKSLLSNLLLLQEKVYHCIQPSVCYEIFVESLLTSSDPANIALAGEMINHAGMPPPDGAVSSTGPMSRDKAVQLVLDAAHEYFDSSANLTDTSMELARSCLLLITDCPASIQEELDLIKALSLLDGFGVCILPIQVRMCKDRLTLIEKAVGSKPFSYKNSQRLLQLAKMLRVSGATNVERDGHVLKIIAQAALKANDHQMAYQTCTRLIHQGYAAIWPECAALAEHANFTDISAKIDLLSFAVSHCAPEMIEPVLRAKCLLETQILYDSANRDMGKRDSTSPDANIAVRSGSASPCEKTFSPSEKSFSPNEKTPSPGEKSFSPLDALRLTSEYLSPKSLLSTANATWQRNKSLAGRWKHWRGTKANSLREHANETVEKQEIHPFYAGVIDKAYVDEKEADYTSCDWSRVEDERLSEVLLRAAKLEEMLTEGIVSHPSSELLLSLAKDAMASDASLALAYLLALPKPLDAAAACFDTVPTSAVSLQLASYYYSLCVYGHHPRPVEPRPDPVYRLDPGVLTRRALLAAKKMVDMVTDGEDEEKKQGMNMMCSLVKMIEHYQEKLTDFTQAHVLRGLGRGVDVVRFTTDGDYRRETILGLAMSLETPVVEIARCLADRHDISLYDVNITHVEYLFDSELTTDELETRLQQPDLLSSLTSDPDRLARHVCERVLPSVSGVDHCRLAACYALLDRVGCSGPVRGIAPHAHVKLLKRIKAVAPELNYTKLLSGDECPLAVIQPILTADNVNALSKLASKIPDQNGGFLQASVVYCAWAVHLFWHGEQSEKRKSLDWIHRFESCSEHMQRLLPEDVVQFSDAIAFVPDSCHLLSTETRAEVVRRILKYSRQTGGKRKKREQTIGMSWEAVADHLQDSLSHLDTLSHPTLIRLRENDDPRHHDYTLQFDLSRSQPEKVRSLLLAMVMDGQPLEMISDLLDVVKVDGWTGRDVVTDATARITQALREDSGITVLHENQKPLDVLRKVVHQVAIHEKSGGSVASTDDVMALLRTFCADNTVYDQTRLRVLETVEQLFNLPDSDLVLLTLYRTQALVLPHWRHLDTLEADRISSDAQRERLFNELLEGSTELSQFNALFEMLKVWPTLKAVNKNACDSSRHPWCQLVKALVTSCRGQSAGLVISMVKHLEETVPLSEQCLRSIFEELVSYELDCTGAICLLIGEHNALYSLATTQLAKHTENLGDNALFDLILQRHLVSEVVTSVYFLPVVEHLLATRPADVPEVAKQLKSTGHDLEAGSLLLRHRELHPTLRTFDMAVGAVTRWLQL